MWKRERTESGKFTSPDNEALVLYEFYLFILVLPSCWYDFWKEYWIWSPAKECLHKIQYDLDCKWKASLLKMLHGFIPSRALKNLLRFHLQVVFPRYGLEFQLALQNISFMILGNWNNLRRGLVLTLAFLVGNWIFDNAIIIFWKLSIMVQRIFFSFRFIS